MEIISEKEFSEKIRILLKNVDCDCVTGPGRSGAISAVYASHILHIPFIPYGKTHPPTFDKILVIDAATETGKTLEKATKKYPNSIAIAVYREPPRVGFWYEGNKPQRYKHEIMETYQLVREKNHLILDILEFEKKDNRSAIEWCVEKFLPIEDDMIVNLYKTSKFGREFIYNLNTLNET